MLPETGCGCGKKQKRFSTDQPDRKLLFAALHAMTEAIAQMKERDTQSIIATDVSFQQQEQDPTNLYISNLPRNINEHELETMLSPYGQVISTRILRDNAGVSKGVGFARYVRRRLRFCKWLWANAPFAIGLNAVTEWSRKKSANRSSANSTASTSTQYLVDVVRGKLFTVSCWRCSYSFFVSNMEVASADCKIAGRKMPGVTWNRFPI